jgi:hypothetical protein
MRGRARMRSLFRRRLVMSSGISSSTHCWRALQRARARIGLTTCRKSNTRIDSSSASPSAPALPDLHVARNFTRELPNERVSWVVLRPAAGAGDFHRQLTFSSSNEFCKTDDRLQFM